MSISIEDLTKEIAVKHGIAVSRNDPIMILHTINERLIKDGIEAQETSLKKLKEDLEVIYQRWDSEANEKAELILNSSLDASKTQIIETLHDETEKILVSINESVQNHLKNYIDQLNINSTDSRRAAVINLVASCITILSVIIITIAMFAR
ncbi:MAG: conjugal transfer protein TraM [Methylococcales bacterium]|nr:conjugal transfer protein TraM [Methylococcales bacterium]